jgi:hypothetical protein
LRANHGVSRDDDFPARERQLSQSRRWGGYNVDYGVGALYGAAGIAIGSPTAADALNYVAGYSCFNDASVRDIQFTHSLTVTKISPRPAASDPGS